MKPLFLSIILLFISAFSSAQVEIKGKILDNESKLPLAGVNIKLKDKLVGTVTNTDYLVQYL